jgi:hypothetical protein
VKKKFQRLTLFRLNKYQKLMCIPIVIAFVLGCCVAWACHFYFAVYNIESQNPTIQYFKILFPWILVSCVFIMFSLFIWICSYTNKLFGPFERIKRELDEILDGKRKTLGQVRKGDEIFEQLVGRINKAMDSKE